MRIHPDPYPGQTLQSQKVEFLHEIFFKGSVQCKGRGRGSSKMAIVELWSGTVKIEVFLTFEL
jgi:hypothetical protein